MIEYSNISLTEGAVSEPVTLDEIKAWLGGLEDVSEFDDMLSGMNTGARQSIENYTNLALVEKTVTLDLDVTCREEMVQLPYAKTIDDVEVNELDTLDAADLQTLGTDYFIRGASVRIDVGRYSVSYTALPGTVPEALKEAIKMEVAERYANRGENGSNFGLSKAAQEKAAPYQVRWL